MLSLCSRGDVRPLAAVVAAALLAPVSVAGAAVDLDGDTNPADPASVFAGTAVTVGITGSGTLAVDGGSQITTGATTLGEGASASGTANVSGAGSRWSGSTLTVGLAGRGEVNVQGGAEISSGAAWLGRTTGSTGVVTVAGAGAKWSSSQAIKVGGESSLAAGAGTGMLRIQEGGFVSAGTITAGDATGSAGAIHVTNGTLGASALRLGYDGAGGLQVRQGGVVTNATADVGVWTKGFGTATIDGAGSIWRISDRLKVGYLGRGEVKINAGAAVQAHEAVIGLYGGSEGLMRVGGGSSFDVDTTLSFGKSGGHGQLSVIGGSVSSSTAFIGEDEQGSGAASFSSASWVNSGAIHVGYGGDGSLEISDRAMVTSAAAYIRNNSSVSVYGGYDRWWPRWSKWNNGGELIMTGRGVNSLTIGQSGWVELGGNLVIAEDADSTSTVHVHGLLNLNGNDIVFGQGQGTFNLDHGVLEDVRIFHGDLQQGGELRIGKSESAGVTFIAGDYAMTDFASLALDLFGAGEGNDKLFVGGDTALTGMLVVSAAGGYAPKTGDSFDLFDFATTPTGEFWFINMPTLGPDLFWRTDRLYSTGEIWVVHAPLPGDLNGDGVVDQADLSLVLTGWGSTSVPEEWSGAFDGMVDHNELGDLLSNWGQGSTTTSAAAAVPEPASMMLLALGGVAMLRRRGPSVRKFS